MNNSSGASTKSPDVTQIDMDSAQDGNKKSWLQGQLRKSIILTLCLGIIIALLATAILIVRFYISYYVVQGHKFDTQGLGIFWPYIILALIILKDILIITGIPLIIAWVIIRFVKTDVIRGRDIQESTMKFLQFHLTFSLVVVLITLLGTIVFRDAILKHIQIWWILFLDIVISLALATDLRPKHLQRSLPRVLISRKMITNIIVHVIYQLAVVLLILLFADKFINVNNGLYERPGSPPSKHFTIIFQTLCLMNIYNAITSRLLFDSISWKKWNGDRNCCEDLRNNFIFHIVLIVLIVLQILIVEFGGAWLWTTSVADQLWICFLFAFIELLLGKERTHCWLVFIYGVGICLVQTPSKSSIDPLKKAEIIVEEYLSEKAISPTEVQYSYWKNIDSSWELFVELSTMYLSAPLSSVESERLFSIARQIL